MTEQIHKVQCQICNSANTQKNSFRFNKKLNAKVQRIYCKDCKCYFSDHPKCRKKYTEEFKEQIIKCHNNRMSTSRIAKTFNISANIVLYWIKKKNTLPSITSVIKPSKLFYTYECDELWTFLGNKKK